MNIHNIENRKYFTEKFIKQVYTTPKYYEMSSQETDYTDMESIDGMEEHDNMYNINGTHYLFAADDVLQKDFSNQLNFKTDVFPVHLVLFRINDSLETPFLEYFLTGTKELAFPFINFKRSDFDNVEQEDNEEEHPINIRFKHLIGEEIIRKTGFDVNKEEFELNDLMKGYFDKNGEFYVFINVPLEEEFDNGYWALYDEIYNIQEINEILINKNAIDLFNNKSLHIIKTTDNKPVKTPVCGYIMTKEDNGEFSNVPVDKPHFEKPYNFDEFEEVYIFSQNPINTGKYQKYAIILEDPLYFHKDKDIKKSNKEQYKSVYYVNKDGVFYLLQYYQQFASL